MKLELFEIYTCYNNAKGHEVVGPVHGFCFYDNGYQDLEETYKNIYFDLAYLSNETKKQLTENWFYHKGSLCSYKAFTIDRRPKNMNRFKWLVFHNFNYLVAKTANIKDREEKIEHWLDIVN